MKRRLTAVWVIALVLAASFGAVHAETDWDSFEVGWVFVTLAQQTSSGMVEFRDAYRVLPDLEQRGVRIIYYEEGTEYLLTAEDAFLLKEALVFFSETEAGEQRQMNGRNWKGFTFTNDHGIILGQIELTGVQENPVHHMLIPTDQMPELAAAIENALDALW